MGCCTKAKKQQTTHVKLEACISLHLILPLLLSLISFLFHSPFKAPFSIFFFSHSTCTVDNTWVFSSSGIVGCRKPQHFSLLSTADGHKNLNVTTLQKLLYLRLSEQVFNFPPAKFISSIKRLVYLLIKLRLSVVSTCKIQRCVTQFSYKKCFQLIWQSKSDWHF